MQWCLIAESLNESAHAKGEHGYGSLIRADGDVTYHHNVYAHHNSRNPRPGSYGEGRGLLLDFKNNLVYDWGSRAGYSSEDPATLNYVGNFLKPGPSTRRKGEAFHVGGQATRLFVAGNIYEGRDDLNADNWKMIGNAAPSNRSLEPFVTASVTTTTAEESYKRLLNEAGAVLPKRDSVDVRIIENIRAGSGRIINSQTEVGGWPELKSRPAPADTDGDGMPDGWEVQHGLDPKDARDGARTAASGYSCLEEYLNQAP